MTQTHGESEAQPVLHPRDVVETIGRVMPEDTLFFCDIGNVTAWAIHYLSRQAPGTFFTDTVWGAMDYAIPAAIGAKLAQPDRPVCALVGDGGALMGSVLDLLTARQERAPIAVVVFNDGGWGMLEHGVAQSPLRDQARPSFRFGVRVDFAQIARSLQAHGRHVTTPWELIAALQSAARPERPMLLDVAIDPAASPPIGGRTAHVNRHMHGH